MSKKAAKDMIQGFSPVVLAYIGDAIFEVLVRCYVVAQGRRKIRDIHKDTVDMVKAESQATVVKKIMPVLTPAEQDMIRRGRNTKSHVPRHADPVDYRLSTGLEALMGYLYLTGNEERLQELFNLSLQPLEKVDEEREE